ncbi:MAG: S1 RNA-binding domain-containing protein, partial [Planctomycetaceae bacterium]|nr:S1 RNA-binding domain-containing protein [Planctomycetaceae bacterium]
HEDQSPQPEAPSRNARVQIPLPTLHGDLSDDLEEEFAEIFGGNELDTILTSADKVAEQPQIESDTKYQGRILFIGRDSAFVELGGREQGAVPLKQFKETPNVGDTIEVKVVRFLAEEGLYELSLPTAAADVADWSQVEEGMVVEAKVTGHNAGGLECEVNRLRAFIPMSQISMFRVENPAEFLNQKLMCVVTECNPARRNLVLSHRALLEREREENRQKLFDELAIGQERDGLVRKLIDSGAFVDLGGVDGFLPISALAWGRVKHPGDVISEGQRIKVLITRIDEVKNRISLSYRDESTDPWLSAEEKFAPKSSVRGKVSKVMDFGAFVELLPGVEGLVHISELSLKRVGSVSEVVQEGDWVDVMVLSVDATNRKISLSMKQLMTPPEPEPLPETEGETPAVQRKEAPLDPVKTKTPRKGPLKGGLSSGSDGDKFGLKF